VHASAAGPAAAGPPAAGPAAATAAALPGSAWAPPANDLRRMNEMPERGAPPASAAASRGGRPNAAACCGCSLPPGTCDLESPAGSGEEPLCACGGAGLHAVSSKLGKLWQLAPARQTHPADDVLSHVVGHLRLCCCCCCCCCCGGACCSHGAVPGVGSLRPGRRRGQLQAVHAAGACDTSKSSLARKRPGLRGTQRRAAPLAAADGHPPSSMARSRCRWKARAVPAWKPHTHSYMAASINDLSSVRQARCGAAGCAQVRCRARERQGAHRSAPEARCEVPDMRQQQRGSSGGRLGCGPLRTGPKLVADAGWAPIAEEHRFDCRWRAWQARPRRQARRLTTRQTARRPDPDGRDDQLNMRLAL
jgi:hypothetical protein